MSRRIQWIDILKCVGIFLVVLGHTIKNNDFYLWIYSFHMPLFFFISGYLSEPKDKIVDYKFFFLNKFRSLFLPFLFFRILLIIYWLVVEQYFRQLDLGPIWFLIVLFWVEILIAPVLLRWNDILHSVLIVFICVILFYIFKSVKSSNEFIHELLGWLERIVNGGLWFSMAFLVRKIGNKLLFFRKYSLVLFGITAIISVFYFKLNGEISIYSNTVNNIVLYIILGLSGINVVWFLCKFVIKKNRIMEWIGAYTIIILAIHEPIKRIILKLISVFCNLDVLAIQSNLMLAFLVAFITLILCVPMIYIFRLIKKNTGKIGGELLCFIK